MLLLSSCSPFENYSTINSIGQGVKGIFNNTSAPVKSSPSGGQIVSNPTGYRMNVGVSNVTSRIKSTCNSQGYCMELAVSK
jgi:hypothetical protein